MSRVSRPLALVAALALVACSSDDVVVTAEDSGTTVRVEVGQTLVVELRENGSTGYLWNVVEAPDERVLRLVGDDYEVDDPDSDGSGGTHTWEYEAVAPGSVTLSMENYFQSEPDKQGMEPFAIEVVVTPAGG